MKSGRETDERPAKSRPFQTGEGVAHASHAFPVFFSLSNALLLCPVEYIPVQTLKGFFHP